MPLDATHKTLFRVSDIKEWKDINEAGKDLYEIARYYYVRELGGEETGGAMHDPLAAFASYDPSIITNWFACNLTAEESGRTISYFEELNLPRKRHHVALDVDTRRFTEEYIDLVLEYIAHLPASLVLERFVSQSPPKYVIAPQWGLKNYEFTNLVKQKMKKI